MAKQSIDRLEHNAEAIKRWRTRLKRAMSMLDKLERQRKRLESKPQARAHGEGGRKPVGVPAGMQGSSDSGLAHGDERPEDTTRGDRPAHPATHPSLVAPIDTSIPAFLKRGVAAQKAVDEIVAEQIKAEQEATKKAKARGRIEKMKAKQRGDLKKMPLTGKAALAAIHGE